MAPIQIPDFDLASSLRATHDEAERHSEDDAMLFDVLHNDQATEFWKGNTALGACPMPDMTISTSPVALASEATIPAKRLHPDIDTTAPKPGKNARVHRKHRERCDAQAAQHGHHPRTNKMVETYIKGADLPIPTVMTHEDFPVSGSGTSASPATIGEEGWQFKDLQEALDAGYTLIQWDGKTCRPLTTAEGKVFIILVGQPDDPTYKDAHQAAYDVLEHEGAKATFTPSKTQHKRGTFPALNVGVTMGMGARYPTNACTGKHEELLARLTSNKHIVRLANFADSKSGAVLLYIFSSTLHSPTLYINST
ncbi:hypothetical protein H0H92_004438 [Tricholoma furcatifolium]|nr:hypothetical protein H0H92_004438 [Tricholoma furcatifolium]